LEARDLDGCFEIRFRQEFETGRQEKVNGQEAEANHPAVGMFSLSTPIGLFS
jgi:hypothetical protein